MNFLNRWLLEITTKGLINWNIFPCYDKGAEELVQKINRIELLHRNKNIRLALF